ncbi:MAG: hypothetical protein P8012_10435, partial [Desulfobacterales bacterium]
FGLIILACFFVFDKNKLIYNESNIFLIKYFPIILIVNGGILFIALGVLFYKKLLIPYFSEAITKFEKAKNQIFIFIFSIPIWISLSAYVFFESENKKQKILWSVLLIYFIWIVISSIKILVKGRESNLIQD